MNVLIIGGSSQDAYFLTQTHILNGDRVFATFRTALSFYWRREQLEKTLVNIENFLPIIDQSLDLSSLNQFFKKTKIDIVYYLASINLPSRSSLSTEAKQDMFRVHVEFPLQLIQTLIDLPNVRSVFPLSSKMFSIKDACDLVVSINEAPNPQTYYGETRSHFWEELKLIRSKYQLNVLSPILFNHESLFRFNHAREEKFVIQRLREMIFSNTDINTIIESGIDFSSREDWLHASDVSTAIYKLVHFGYAGDIVIASGRGSSISDLLLEFFEKNQRFEAVRQIDQQLASFDKYRPCLIGDIRGLRQIIGEVEHKNVLE